MEAVIISETSVGFSQTACSIPEDVIFIFAADKSSFLNQINVLRMLITRFRGTLQQRVSWESDSRSNSQSFSRLFKREGLFSCSLQSIVPSTVSFIARSWSPVQPPSWRTAPCRLSETDYTIYVFAATTNLRMRPAVVVRELSCCVLPSVYTNKFISSESN
jgi:hypothetical protein